MRLAVFSAFPHELRHIAGQFRRVGKTNSPCIDLCLSGGGRHELVIVQTGMGHRNILKSFDFAMEEYRPEFVISAGFGGALYDGAAAGDLVRACEISLVGEGGEGELPLTLEEGPDHGDVKELASKLSERVELKEGTFFTLATLMEKSVLRRLIPPEKPFAVCEMESYFLAGKCAEKGLPFLAVRAITDRADEDIPAAFSGIMDEAGMYSLTRALRIVAKPSLLIPGIKLGINSHIASRNLGRLIMHLTEIM